MRRALVCCLAILMVIGFAFSASAAVPYESFVQTESHTDLPSPPSFEVVKVETGLTMGGEEWDTPQDLVFDAHGTLYLLDSRNNRIVLYDKDLQFLGEICTLKREDGTEDCFGRPQSLCVTDDGFLYVADTNNERCLKLDKEGNILREYRRPEDKAYTSEVFYPTRILVNAKDGMVYVISQNVYQGIILFTEEGEFGGYFGSPPVAVSAKLLFDRFWKGIMTKEMREGLADYVPVEYTSMDIDKEGFVYAVSTYTESGMEQIRRLNYLGNNILPNKGNLGEQETVYYRSEVWNSQFTDICVAGDNMVALDSRYQRLYVLNMQGNRLMTFGTSGNQQGAFLRASAVAYRDGFIYVLDSLKNNLTIFRPTPYGQLILDASAYDATGDYDKAVTYWNQVLEQNANCEMAYNGIGEAMLKNGEYRQAVDCFRLSNNLERESVAFGYLRTAFFRANMGWIIILLLVGLVVLYVFSNRRITSALFKRLFPNRVERPMGQKPVWALAGQVMTHPLETFNELKHMRYQNISFIGVVLLLWTVIHILTRQFTGFRFSSFDPNTFNLPVEIAVAVLPFILIAVVNWAVCAIMDGEGKFFEICTNLAFAMLPYMIFSLFGLVLSRCLVLDEVMFLSFAQWIGILWSLVLVFHGQRFVHNYSTKKTIITAVLTILGVLIVLVILLLAFTLVLQVSNFVTSIYTELSLRK